MDLPVCWDLDEVSVCVQFLERTVSLAERSKRTEKKSKLQNL